ncbi:MAG: hypothetical protein AVDCRST_MAG15-1110, partial [uncultured Rubellimicrobium sp.]
RLGRPDAPRAARAAPRGRGAVDPGPDGGPADLAAGSDQAPAGAGGGGPARLRAREPGGAVPRAARGAVRGAGASGADRRGLGRRAGAAQGAGGGL